MQKIFVHSCGNSRREPSHEYRWQSLQGPAADSEVGAILNEKRLDEYSIAQLVQSDSRVPSLVLTRSEGLIHLFVSRLASATRHSSQGETLYNSVLIVSNDEHDMMAMRTLAGDVLASYPVLDEDFKTIAEGQAHGILSDALDRVIQDDEEVGFRVVEDQDFVPYVEERIAELNLYPASQNSFFRWSGAVGHNCGKLRAELAYELKHFSFPRSDGPLVVVTGIKALGCFEEAYVWRGLSLLAESLSWQKLRQDWRRQRVHDQQERSRQGEVLIEVQK